MSEIVDNIKEFVDYVGLLSGDEKGEAQVFCDRLFQAFGHDGYKEAGATLEFRIKKESTKGTSFADLIWKPRLLIEMKKRGEKPYKHYKQAFDYWIHAVPNRPQYVVLCNFDEFWIYDFDKQLDQPVDIVTTEELPKRYTVLNFLFPDNPEPIFGNDQESVSRDAADKVAQLFNSLLSRGIDRKQSQRFVLQTVIAMFAEDIDLLPAGIIHSIVDDCLSSGQSSFDLFGALYKQMDSQTPATGGRFVNVPYFNGGIFSDIEPIDLTNDELSLIAGEDGASNKDWSKVNPAIFGTIFQNSMDKDARHAYGAHFTHEADILRIVTPTITRPWMEIINKASSKAELLKLRESILNFRVLDPACGSGNFLYLSYREIVRLEVHLLLRIKEEFSEKEFNKHIKSVSLVSPKQFFGIDRDEFGVELAKVTLMLAKKLAMDEAHEILDRSQFELPFATEEALPLDNLDENIVCGDALFAEWPDVDVIIGNPPYQSKNKMQQELGRAYVNKIRDKYPDIDGRADYCVYWLRRAHDHLKDGQRAGLVGTNTIRQNYSRYGGLDYIVNNGGVITEAVSSMKWSGEAVVYVSIVNWIKSDESGLKRLYVQEDQNDASKGWSYKDMEVIGASLSFQFDITTAKKIKTNAAKCACYQGQTHGHSAFLLSVEKASSIINMNSKYADVLHPFLIANELIGNKNSLPNRYVIDFSELDLLTAKSYVELYRIIESSVLPDRQEAAKKEKERNRIALESNPHASVNHHHHNFLNSWWVLSYPRKDMKIAIKELSRYIVCGQVTKRPIFEFISPTIYPNAALIVFPYDDDYSFGILQSMQHWLWFTNRCSTLKGDPRYTSNTVFDTFAWPQSPSEKDIGKVAQASKKLRELRRNLMEQHDLSLRDLYRSIEVPGAHPLKDAINKLDQKVRIAYGMKDSDDVLEFLMSLNEQVVIAENSGKVITRPGLPTFVNNREQYISDDCLVM